MAFVQKCYPLSQAKVRRRRKQQQHKVKFSQATLHPRELEKQQHQQRQLSDLFDFFIVSGWHFIATRARVKPFKGDCQRGANLSTDFFPPIFRFTQFWLCVWSGRTSVTLCWVAHTPRKGTAKSRFARLMLGYAFIFWVFALFLSLFFTLPKLL